jgi:tetratricopeptide (TPR) repeat protein
VPTELRLAAYAAASIGDDIRGNVLKSLVSALGMDPRDAMNALTRAQILLPLANDQYRWPHALLQEHLMQRLHERNDAPAIFRLAANALAKHPAVGSRRIMKHRVTNLLRAGDDDIAAGLMFQFIAGSWRRGRDTAATLRDLELLEGRVTGHVAAEYSLWRAEALRHIGRLEEAKEHAELAKQAFERSQDASRTAHALRLLGHIASDLGSPAQGRVLVADAQQRFELLGDELGKSQAEVVLGEIDYLLGNHALARTELHEASVRCSATGDVLGRAQCLLILALTETAAGGFEHARTLLQETRAEFDRIGYQLGLAQCDIALAHADYRAFDPSRAGPRARLALAAFRELQNPRGEAACERLLAMLAFDADRYAEASSHAGNASRLFARMQDPWGEVESGLLLAQVALARGDEGAAKLVLACDRVVLDEAEPRQHRHLTRAWLAQRAADWTAAADEIERARTAFHDSAQTGDHTPALLKRLSKLHWEGPARASIGSWLQGVERSEADLSRFLVDAPSAPGEA